VKRVYVGYIDKENIPKWDSELTEGQKKNWGGWVTIWLCLTKKRSGLNESKVRITIETIKDGKK
jgi:hypothetical protein